MPVRIRGFLIALALGLTAATVVPATANAAASCYASGVHAGYSTATCHIYRTNHPWYMYGSATLKLVGNVDGILYAGNSWFVCQRRFGVRIDYGAVENDWFAYTLSDNGYWGWVSATHFSAGGNWQPVPGLATCPSGFGDSSTYPGDRPRPESRLELPGPDGGTVTIN